MRLRQHILVVLALLSACTSSDRSSDGAALTGARREASLALDSASPETAPAPPGIGIAGSAAGNKVDADRTYAPERLSASQAPQLPSDSGARTVAPSMVIRTGTASIQVDSLEPALAAVREVAARVGGWIANTSVQTGRDQIRSGTIEIKVPSARFDEAVAALRPIGKVEAVNVSAEDVGEEFVDVTARVANARRLEERLIDLLTRRTGRLEDVLAVERELARVREEIERYEGRLRYLRTRVSFSTLTVTVHEPLPIVGGVPGYSPITEAFRDAWRNFVGFIAALIASLGVLVPLGVLAALGWAAWRRWRRSHPDVAAPRPIDAGGPAA